MQLELTMKAFRAKTNLTLRDKYHHGLEQVLLHYGVTKVTSQSRDWFDSENTWLVLVESNEDGQILGGARMQLAEDNLPLPMEKAIGFKDARIYEIVNEYKKNGVGEFCGLWNSRKVAGMGLGSMYLGEACISIAPKIGFNTVLGLCAPSTKQNSFKLGFQIDNRLGLQGEFNYPKENLVATALFIEDIHTLATADETSRKHIFQLRAFPELITDESTKRGDLKLFYHL